MNSTKLRRCPDCGAEVSRTADKCPKCGAVLPSAANIVNAIGALLSIGLTVWIFWKFGIFKMLLMMLRH